MNEVKGVEVKGGEIVIIIWSDSQVYVSVSLNNVQLEEVKKELTLGESIEGVWERMMNSLMSKNGVGQ